MMKRRVGGVVRTLSESQRWCIIGEGRVFISFFFLAFESPQMCCCWQLKSKGLSRETNRRFMLFTCIAGSA